MDKSESRNAKREEESQALLEKYLLDTHSAQIVRIYSHKDRLPSFNCEVYQHVHVPVHVPVPVDGTSSKSKSSSSSSSRLNYSCIQEQSDLVVQQRQQMQQLKQIRADNLEANKIYLCPKTKSAENINEYCPCKYYHPKKEELSVAVKGRFYVDASKFVCFSSNSKSIGTAYCVCINSCNTNASTSTNASASTATCVLHVERPACQNCCLNLFCDELNSDVHCGTPRSGGLRDKDKDRKACVSNFAQTRVCPMGFFNPQKCKFGDQCLKAHKGDEVFSRVHNSEDRAHQTLYLCT